MKGVNTKPLSDQFPVRVRSCALCILTVCACLEGVGRTFEVWVKNTGGGAIAQKDDEFKRLTVAAIAGYSRSWLLSRRRLLTPPTVFDRCPD